MADSLLSSLLQTLDNQTIGQMSNALGDSGQAIARGAESSVASVLGGLASQSQDPSLLRRMIEAAPEGAGWSSMVDALRTADSPLIAGAKRILSGLFGTSEPAVVNAVSRESGLGNGTASTLLAMAAPVVMSFIGRRVRDGAMSMNTLGEILQRETPTIRAALPAGLSDLFWPRTAAPVTGVPVATRTTTPQRSGSSWAPAIALAVIALGIFWLFNHAHRQATGTAARMESRLGNFVKRGLPNHKILDVPEYGVESRLLGFIQNPNMKPDSTTWFDFDRVTFDTGSPRIRPESREQLDNIAAILQAYPNVDMKIGGFTDNVGGANENLVLSKERADAIKSELARRGVAGNRLTSEGYGEQYPIGDNSTEEGRARNRRVSMQVTRK